MKSRPAIIYCLSTLCPRRFDAARKLLVSHFQSVCYCSLFSGWSQLDSLSLPFTRATRKQRTNKLGRRYLPQLPFCMLARYTLRRKTAPFTYMFVPSSEWAGNARSRWSLPRRRVPPGAWMSVVNVVCCQVVVSATSWSLVQRSPTDCSAS
jgi:hypothetical protein